MSKTYKLEISIPLEQTIMIEEAKSKNKPKVDPKKNPRSG